MGDFKFIDTKIKDLYIIEPSILVDERGYFMENYNKNDFLKAGLDVVFVQENESKSKKGVLRGMHFQTKHTQGKLVRVTKGEVYDVAIDLRKKSSTYGQWVGVFLSEENKKSFYIPKGFAHGFLVTSEEAIFNYKCTDFYAPEYECGLLWNDKDIGINWPLNEIDKLVISEKDNSLKALKELHLEF